MRLFPVLLLLVFCLPAAAEQPYVWSSTACPRCQSTIVYQHWYSDGSPMVAEGMSGKITGVFAALSLRNNTMVLSLGLNISHEPSLNLALRGCVTLETDSSAHTVLYALDEPGPGIHKDDVTLLRSLNPRILTLRPFAPASGFLFFPADPAASHITVVVRVGGEVFRFPFARDRVDPAKFGDPAKLPFSAPIPATASVAAKSCAQNVSFAVTESGELMPQEPDFAGKWLAKNAARYPGICFSQTPDARVPNYLVAFAPSEQEFDGFQPAVSGAAWTYHANALRFGTQTTTSYISLPYSKKTRALYAFTYDQSGQVISRRQRTVTTHQGAGPVSNMGVGVAAAIAASHMKEQLLFDAVTDLTRFKPAE